MRYKTLIFFVTLCLIVALSEKLKNYGSFNIVITKVDLCRGPKRRECSVFNVKINNSVTIDFNVLITENMSPTKGKVLAISNGNEFVRIQLKKPCENLFLRPIFHNLLNITDKCVIKKGRYIFSVDFQESLRNYYGGKYFYGLYAFKSIYYGVQCNLACITIEVKITGNK